MCIDCTERIVQEIYISILIESTGKLNPLLLPATEIHSSFSYLGEISIWEQIEVFYQGTALESLSISLTIHLRPKEDVLLYSSCLDPCSLRNISNRSVYSNLRWKTRAD